MEETILSAMDRLPKTKKAREANFIAGVLYGDTIDKAISVQFDRADLTKILTKHGSNAKLWIQYGDSKKFGFIKDIQKDPITRKVKHVDVYIVSQSHEVKMELPINFKGKENLEHKALLLQVYKSNVIVFGKATLIPDSLVMDVSDKNQGDTITAKDFDLAKEIKIMDSEEEVYGIITSLREQSVENPPEEETTKTAPLAV